MITQTPKPKQQIKRILELTSWSRDYLADMLEISNFSLGRYLSGLRKPPEAVVEKTTFLYTEIVVPLECEITRLKNTAEQKLLADRLRTLKSNTPTSCPT